MKTTLAKFETNKTLDRGCRENIFEVLGKDENPFWGKPFAELELMQDEWAEKAWLTYGPSFGFLDNGRRFLANPEQALWHRLALEQYQRLQGYWIWLRGAAGTGKTFTLTRVFGKLLEKKMGWYLCPSNQAAEESRKALIAAGFSGLAGSVQTPHTRFELANPDHGFFGKPGWWPNPPGASISGKNRVFALDEVFFFDARTLALTLACIPTGATVIAAGDHNQNRPVDGTEVARHLHSRCSKKIDPEPDPVFQVLELLKSEHINPPSITLTKVYRAENQGIITAAHAVLRGEFPEAGEGFSVTRKPTTDDAIEYVASKCREGFYACVPTNPLAIRVSAEINKNRVGTGDEDCLYMRPGDKVRVLVNDHRAGLTNGMECTYERWRRPLDTRRGYHEISYTEKKPDGMIGKKLFRLYYQKDLTRSILRKPTDELRRELGEDCMRDLVGQEQRDSASGLLCHANVLTVHRAQGSTLKKVVVLIPAWLGPWQCREWLYTAITRAKTEVEIVVSGKPDTSNTGAEAVLLDAVRARLLAPRPAAPDALGLGPIPR